MLLSRPLQGTYLNGKWLLEARLGSGGVATVYRATHRNGTTAAIKILDEERSEDEDVRRRFLREGYVANSVGHPGAVRILDDDVSPDGRVFLVMELLDGEPLDEHCTRLGGRMPVQEALAAADAILDVLAAAHDKGIVHRDIKPANIFLTRSGGIKVLDFGLAKIKSTMQGDSTAVGALLGTPGYMAPEVARAARDDDARADVWSVGATLFKLLTGQHPFEAADMLALLVATTREMPRPIERVAAEVAAEIPPAVADVIDRALSVDLARRWPDARTMQTALRAAREEPVSRRRIMPSLAEIADENDPTVMHNGPQPALSSGRMRISSSRDEEHTGQTLLVPQLVRGGSADSAPSSSPAKSLTSFADFAQLVRGGSVDEASSSGDMTEVIPKDQLMVPPPEPLGDDDDDVSESGFPESTAVMANAPVRPPEAARSANPPPSVREASAPPRVPRQQSLIPASDIPVLPRAPPAPRPAAIAPSTPWALVLDKLRNAPKIMLLAGLGMVAVGVILIFILIAR
jgi:eukaryotic-like serine/threonine-protein kinase